MSPRNDTYLSLCLAQAELSPLHYRHGSIIIRDGKVIGQGFNCYRPGFDGGVLKTSTLPSSSLDGLAIAELKQRLKSKPKPKCKSKSENQSNQGTFTSFESIGCGHGINGPLSMHSEMMAIRSALSLSAGTLSSHTSARSAKYFQKPCFKLSGDSKNGKPEREASKHTRKPSSTRRRILAAPKVASSQFKSRVLNKIPLNQVSKDNTKSNNKEDSNEFYEKNYQNKAQQKHYQHKRGSEPHSMKTIISPSIALSEVSTSKDDFISTKSSKSKYHKKPPPDPPPKAQQILITKKKSLNTKPNVAARTKDLRLKGSDLYVCRLGSLNTAPRPLPPPPTAKDLNPALPPTTSSLSPKSEPLSLYDELSLLSRSTSPSTSSSSLTLPESEHHPEVRASRPCYRCVTAMHAVGIKRVFWTNQDGQWEGAKVRDLVEALEVGIEGDNGEGLGTGQENKGVFVTKHEVLMLKRSLGF